MKEETKAVKSRPQSLAFDSSRALGNTPEKPKEVMKVDTRNNLHKFFDYIFATKMHRRFPSKEEIAKLEAARTPFTGQHTSGARQARLKHMAHLGIASGKTYQRYMKKLRREQRECLYSDNKD